MCVCVCVIDERGSNVLLTSIHEEFYWLAYLTNIYKESINSDSKHKRVILGICQHKSSAELFFFFPKD